MLDHNHIRKIIKIITIVSLGFFSLQKVNAKTNTSEFFNVVLGMDCKSADSTAFVYFGEKGVPKERIFYTKGKITVREKIVEFKEELDDRYNIIAKDSADKVSNDLILLKNNRLSYLKRELDGKSLIADGLSIQTGKKVADFIICQANTALLIAVSNALQEESRIKREAEIAQKDKEKEIERQELEEKNKQVREERLAYFKTPQGKKDFDNFQKILPEIIGKTLASDCNSTRGIVWVFKGEKGELSKRLNYSADKPVTEDTISLTDYLGKEILLLTLNNDSGSRNIEFKINQKFIQVYNNGNLVKEGINSSGNSQPVSSVCGVNTSAAKIVANENNGTAARLREEKAEDSLINTNEVIKMTKLPSHLVERVCSRVVGLSASGYSPNLMYQPGALKEIMKNNGFSFLGASVSGNSCNYKINITGNYGGNSYNKTMSCKIFEVVKSDKANGYLIMGDDTCI